MFVALVFEHRIGRPQIRWIVVECTEIGRKCGGPQAQPPRRDIAYFVSEWTARRDAIAFADYKNSANTENERLHEMERNYPLTRTSRNQAYEWDHQFMAPLLKWGVLQWSGDENIEMPREDVAYFVDSDTAEADACAFERIRNVLAEREIVAGRGTSASVT